MDIYGLQELLGRWALVLAKGQDLHLDLLWMLVVVVVAVVLYHNLGGGGGGLKRLPTTHSPQ